MSKWPPFYVGIIAGSGPGIGSRLIYAGTMEISSQLNPTIFLSRHPLKVIAAEKKKTDCYAGQ
jgi:hypothetical protein